MSLEQEKQLYEKITVKLQKINNQLTNIEPNDPQQFEHWLIFESAWILSNQAKLDVMKLEKLHSAAKHLISAQHELKSYGIESEDFSNLSSLIEETITLTACKIGLQEPTNQPSKFF